jgi:hypothetical protein
MSLGAGDRRSLCQLNSMNSLTTGQFTVSLPWFFPLHLEARRYRWRGKYGEPNMAQRRAEAFRSVIEWLRGFWYESVVSG